MLWAGRRVRPRAGRLPPKPSASGAKPGLTVERSGCSTASAARRGHFGPRTKRPVVEHRSVTAAEDGCRRQPRQAATDRPSRDGVQGSRPRTSNRRGETAARGASADSGYDNRASNPSQRHARSSRRPQRLTYSAASAGGKCRSWLGRGHDEMSSTAIGKLGVGPSAQRSGSRARTFRAARSRFAPGFGRIGQRLRWSKDCGFP
jgi:hypothetical protein